MTIDYLPNLVQKILALEAPGGPPASVSAVVPTITRPGEPFDVKIAVLDASGYASVCCEEPVHIDGLPGVAFGKGQPALATVRGACIHETGLHRLVARVGNHRFFSNPTLCTNRPAQPIYWGDPHCHSALGYCMPATCRSLNYLFCAARYLSALDWVAATDHVSNGRGDPGKWKDQCAVSELFHDPVAGFATLPAYEASFKGGAGGDHNVYLSRFPDMFVDDYDGGSIKTVCGRLRELYPDLDFFVAPHHTSRAVKHGEISDEIYVGPDLSPVVEIHSKWGTSEYPGNPNPLHKPHAGPSYVVDFLNRGLKFGFVAGTDSHASMPGGRGVEPSHIDRLPGLTAVRADSLARRSIFDAIRGRHCYATSLERIYLDVTTTPPSESKPPREIHVITAAQSDIVAIELVRNGEVIDRRNPASGWNAELIFRDERIASGPMLRSPHLGGRFAYLYVRVTCASGAMAWSSPMWVVMER